MIGKVRKYLINLEAYRGEFVDLLMVHPTNA